MAPGRKPKPSWLKVVTGNPGRRPLNKNEPRPEGALAPPPHWFTAEQRAQWTEKVLAAPAGLLTALDHGTMVRWAVAAALHADSCQMISKYGAMVKTPVTGAPMQSPYVSIMNTQAKLLIRYDAELGFTPSARSRVSIAAKRKGKSETPFDDLKELGD